MEIIKKFDVTAVQRVYEKDGEKKKFRQRVGEITIMKGENGNFTKMTWFSNPALELDVYEQKPREDRQETVQGDGHQSATPF